ncbi:hypothetical protein [Hymenobacter jejuensis]|uniref:Uncharacterized protein n=1 Tax=Hymenobacter jejuensis TaxID=2502781 RepID=A0A5B8A4F8_9BACT|nr:hypothetical protein [Hymenobacter jejuensis]QDA61505.1 hypothetical protein FHG12_15990 [Hymenobacter jejuensis]
MLITVLASCTGSLQDERSQPNSNVMPAETNRPPVATKPVAPPTALDTTNFSPQFLQELKQLMDREKYSVRGQWLIVGNNDSVAFPAELPKRQSVVYAASAGDRTYKLTVTRRNFTTLRYAAEVTERGKRISYTTGTADLKPSFYVAAEVPIDTKTQTAYGASEYVSSAKSLSLLIGTGPDADKAEVYTANAKGQTLPAWRNAPTLRRQ